MNNTQKLIERLRAAQDDFEAALNAMPFGAERIAADQQFNAYESARNNSFDSPDDWEFILSLGPITDAVRIMGIESEWRAKLIESALRVAMRARHRVQSTALLKAAGDEMAEAARSAVAAPQSPARAARLETAITQWQNILKEQDDG